MTLLFIIINLRQVEKSPLCPALTLSEIYRKLFDCHRHRHRPGPRHWYRHRGLLSLIKSVKVQYGSPFCTVTSKCMRQRRININTHTHTHMAHLNVCISNGGEKFNRKQLWQCVYVCVPRVCVCEYVYKFLTKIH